MSRIAAFASVIGRRCNAQWLVVIGLVAVCGAIYANALDNELVVDDRVIILEDVRVQRCEISRLLTGNYWYKPGADLLYRPLVMASYALNWAVSREPWTFRLINLALHTAACIALFRLMVLLFDSFWAALAAALLFATHPVHTEALNLVVGRADVAVALLMLVATVLYWQDAEPVLAEQAGNRRIRTIPTRGPRRPSLASTTELPYCGRKTSHLRNPSWRPALAAVLFAIALLCKEHALTLIGVIALLDWYRWYRPEARRKAFSASGGWLRARLLRCYLPMLIVIIAYLAARSLVLGTLLRSPARIDPVDNPIAHPEYDIQAGDSVVLARWATPLVTFSKAASLMIWPAVLCHDYSFAAIETVKRVADPRLAESLLWLAAVIVPAVISYRRQRAAFIAVAITLVTYSIVSNTIIIIGTIFAERLLYVPSIGFCMLVGLFVGAAIGKLSRAAQDPAGRGSLSRFVRDPLGLASAVILSVFTLTLLWFCHLVIDRNRVWQSGAHLTEKDFQVNPRSCRLLTARARALGKSDPDAALALCRQAIRLAPRFSRTWWTAAYVYREKGDTEQAWLCVQNSFRVGAGGDAPAAGLAAEILVERGQYEEAIKRLKRTLSYQPISWQLHNNLANYLIEAEPVSLRDPYLALHHAQQALEQNPNGGAPIDTYVSVLLALRRDGEALEALVRLLPAVRNDDKQRPRLEERLRSLRGDVPSSRKLRPGNAGPQTLP